MSTKSFQPGYLFSAAGCLIIRFRDACQCVVASIATGECDCGMRFIHVAEDNDDSVRCIVQPPPIIAPNVLSAFMNRLSSNNKNSISNHSSSGSTTTTSTAAAAAASNAGEQTCDDSILHRTRTRTNVFSSRIAQQCRRSYPQGQPSQSCANALVCY